MAVTSWTIVVAGAGLLFSIVLMGAQIVAVARPRASWTIENIYGGRPDDVDSKAYFVFYQAFARADVFFWLPVQMIGSVGMLMGQRWGFLLALIGSVPFWYTAIMFYVWDRDLKLRQNTFVYWVLVWGIFPVFGVLEGVYCFLRLFR